jgi:hypothetical protein
MSSDLRHFIDQAHETHAQQPRAVADALQDHAAALPADDDGAEAVRLAEHVMLGHLGDAGALQQFLRALQLPPTAPGDAWTTALQRARWAHACLTGGADSVPVPADGPRWRAQQNVVLAHALAGRTAEASALLRQDEATAATHADADARRAYAACANNVALELREGPRGDAARDALMLEAAALSRRAWQAAGTWLHMQRADYQLARCHAVLAQAAPALASARACLGACRDHDAPAEEHFFAHEALWHAHQAAGEAGPAAEALARMRALLDGIADPDMRRWCVQTLASMEAAAGPARP